MELIFHIDGQTPDPPLGIVEGYIHESINEVTTTELTLVSSIDFSESECADFVGKMVSIVFRGLFDGELKYSRFDGRIYEFHIMDMMGVEKGLFKYQMIVRPRLWDLNFTVRAQSFPNKTRCEVVEDVLKEHGFQSGYDYTAKYHKPAIYRKQNQIIQNQTSDLILVQSLLSEAGINYFFTADKNGEKPELLKLADNNIFFDDYCSLPVIYNPDSGQNGDYRIESMETHFRAIPKQTVASSNLGDGKTQVFTAKSAIKDGNLGEFHCFSTEGEDCDISKQTALIRSQYFESNRIVHEGRSNFFLFRSGEKFKVRDIHGIHETKMLIRSVFHHFYQTPNSAISNDNSVEYSNYFLGHKKNAELRPDQTDAKTIVDLKRMLTQYHSKNNQALSLQNASENTGLDNDVESHDLKKKIIALRNELAIARDLSGIMVGEVIEDAKLTPNRELVCKVKNERFPEGIYIKVALGWLTERGWLSLLPRVGVQVYFQFINSKGGQYDAVLIGYRPTSDHPLLNPSNKTESSSLDTNDEDEIGNGKFSPINKYRNSLMGANEVAEIAVIDGGEDSVYMHANNRICAIGDKSVNISTKSLKEKAGFASQSFGGLRRTVHKNQNVKITKDLERVVNGNSTETTTKMVKIESVEESVEMKGSKRVKVYDSAGAAVEINGNSIAASLSEGSDVFLSLVEKCAVLKAKDAEINLLSDGTIQINGKGNVFINGQQSISVNGQNTVSIEGKQVVNVNGSSVNINCSAPPQPHQKPSRR